MHASMHASMHACIQACILACIHPASMHASMHGCMHPCIHPCNKLSKCRQTKINNKNLLRPPWGIFITPETGFSITLRRGSRNQEKAREPAFWHHMIHGQYSGGISWTKFHSRYGGWHFVRMSSNRWFWNTESSTANFEPCVYNFEPWFV